MKALINTTNKNLIAIFILCIFTLLSGCKKETISPESLSSDRVEETNEAESINCEAACEKTVDLMAGQHIKVGSVHYKNNPDGYIYVTYTVNAPWEITFVSLYIGNCSQIPKNLTGNPIPGQFPYKYTLPDGTTSYTIKVSRNSVPNCGCIAAHASVKNTQTGATETAWGKGTRFTYTNWAMYYQYCLADCLPNCGYSAWYWFVDQTTPWPKSSLNIGGYIYSKADCYSIVHAETGYNNIPDAKKCFTQICAAKLSAANIAQNSPIWGDVDICEDYLQSLGQKLNENYLPTGDENALAAAERIELWLKANPCIGK
jgi:hypothetical protein